MAEYELYGNWSRWINTRSDISGQSTRFRVKATISTTDYADKVGIRIWPVLIFGKDAYGPQVVTTDRDYVIHYNFNTYHNYNKVAATTWNYGQSQAYTQVNALNTDPPHIEYYIYKTTSAQTETIQIQWYGGSIEYYPTTPIQVVNSTSWGDISITIPALQAYSITYNANGGSGAPSNQTKYYGININLQSGIPTRSGYAFRYWNTSNTGSGTTYNSGASYSANADLSLYAIWHQCPTITSVNVTSTAPYYNNGKNYTVSYSGITTYDGTSINKIELRIGSYTASPSSTSASGSVSLKPTQTGTFTPQLIITDSWGATYTRNLSPITVKQYVAPSVIIASVERTDVNGVPSESSSDAGYGLLTVTFNIPSKDGYNLTTPSVGVSRSNGTDVGTHDIAWFATRDSTSKVVSNSYSGWSTMTSGTTVYLRVSNCYTSYAYDISIIPNDTRASGTQKTGVVPALFYTIDFLAGGHGIAFGAPAIEEGFDCEMETTFGNDIYINLEDNGSSTTDTNLITIIGNLNWTSAVQ